MVRYKRIFRTLTFKKALGNKIIAEIEDTVISGADAQVFRIRPKVLYVLKLNFGEWSYDDFDQQSLLQRFQAR